jgi:hypothetical protein
MWKLGSMIALSLLAAVPAVAQSKFADLRGIWKGTSESIISGMGNSHHAGTPDNTVKRSSVPFTLKIDMEDGRRFSGTFASPRASETVIGVISNTGAIYIVSANGYSVATLLGPNQLELCYMQVASFGQVASCTEFTKQP